MCNPPVLSHFYNTLDCLIRQLCVNKGFGFPGCHFFFQSLLKRYFFKQLNTFTKKKITFTVDRHWFCAFELLIELRFSDRSHREREKYAYNTQIYSNITNEIKIINAPLTKHKPMKMESHQQLHESVVCPRCNGPHRKHIHFSFNLLKHIIIWLQELNFLFNIVFFLFYIFFYDEVCLCSYDVRL